jgi:hypothetical protein
VLQYAPIANVAAEYYNTSTSTINWLSMIFMVIYLVVGPLSTWWVNSTVTCFHAQVCGGSGRSILTTQGKVTSAIPVHFTNK